MSRRKSVCKSWCRQKAREQVAGVSQPHREQPHHAHHAGFIVEHDLEVGEVHLRLLPGRGLEAHLEQRGRSRAHLAHEIAQHGLAPGISQRADLAQQARDAELRIGAQTLLHIRLESSITRARGWRGPYTGASRPRSMYLRTVLRSRPVRSAIAEIVRPCLCRSRITINSLSLITPSLPCSGT